MFLHHRLKIEIHISCDGVAVSIYPILSNFVEHLEAVGPYEGFFKTLVLNCYCCVLHITIVNL